MASSSGLVQVFDLSDDDLEVSGEVDGEAVVTLPPDIASITAPYWVSLTRKKGFRRLHRAEGCHCVAEHYEEVDDIAHALFNSKCGHCWRLGKKASGTKISARAAEDSDSSVTTDSESSSSSGS